MNIQQERLADQVKVNVASRADNPRLGIDRADVQKLIDSGLSRYEIKAALAEILGHTDAEALAADFYSYRWPDET